MSLSHSHIKSKLHLTQICLHRNIHIYMCMESSLTINASERWEEGVKTPQLHLRATIRRNGRTTLDLRPPPPHAIIFKRAPFLLVTRHGQGAKSTETQSATCNSPRVRFPLAWMWMLYLQPPSSSCCQRLFTWEATRLDPAEGSFRRGTGSDLDAEFVAVCKYLTWRRDTLTKEKPLVSHCFKLYRELKTELSYWESQIFWRNILVNLR
jgi:hypothetical protein